MMADTGWKSPGTCADDATVGTIAWSNPDNAKTSNSVYATATAVGNRFFPVYSGLGKLVKGGSISGDSLISPGLTWSYYNGQYISGGGNSSLWGLELTPSDVNSSNFGFAIYAQSEDNTSHYLKATNFGFAIPAGATIDGVLVETKIGVSGSYGANADIDHIQMKVYYTEGAVSAPRLLSLTGVGK